MKKKEEKSPTDFETIKIKRRIVEKVRDNKEKTGVPIGTFFELAAEEKLKTKQNA